MQDIGERGFEVAQAKAFVKVRVPAANCRRLVGPLGAMEHVIYDRAKPNNRAGDYDQRLILGRGRSSSTAWIDARNTLNQKE